MARKKKETKTKEKLEIKVAPPVVLTEAEDIIAALKNLKNVPGWQIVVNNLKDNIKYLELEIIKKMDLETGERLTDEEVDKLRVLRDLNEEMLETPNKLIERLEKPVQEEYNPDPYFSTETTGSFTIQ